MCGIQFDTVTIRDGSWFTSMVDLVCAVYIERRTRGIGFCGFFVQAEDGIRDLVRSRGLGDVYKRQVVNIEPSIQAAFVDFGVGRNGFLHVSDVEYQYYKHLMKDEPEEELSLIHI